MSTGATDNTPTDVHPTGDSPSRTHVVLLGASNLTLAFPHLVETLAWNLDRLVQPARSVAARTARSEGVRPDQSANGWCSSQHEDAAVRSPRAGSGLTVWAAHGHGRSYGVWSRVLGRALPGIVSCRLWHELQEALRRETSVNKGAPAPAATPADAQASQTDVSRHALAATTVPVEVTPDHSPRVLALLTDVGNDILYGSTPEKIADWVEQCLRRLNRLGARVVLTGLPLDSVRHLSRWRYRLFRTCFFPTCRLSYDVALQRGERLDERLRDLAARYQASFVEPNGRWYGFDPIHIRRRFRPAAWSLYLGHWFDPPTPVEFRRAGLWRAVRLWTLCPAERRWCGRDQRRRQPAERTADGLELRLY